MLEDGNVHLGKIGLEGLQPLDRFLARRSGDLGGVEDHHVVEHHVVEAVGLLADADELGLEALIVLRAKLDRPPEPDELQIGRGIDHSFTGYWIASLTALVVSVALTYMYGFKESDLTVERTVKKVRLGRREPAAT